MGIAGKTLTKFHYCGYRTNFCFIHAHCSIRSVSAALRQESVEARYGRVPHFGFKCRGRSGACSPPSASTGLAAHRSVLDEWRAYRSAFYRLSVELAHGAAEELARQYWAMFFGAWSAVSRSAASLASEPHIDR